MSEKDVNRTSELLKYLEEGGFSLDDLVATIEHLKKNETPIKERIQKILITLGMNPQIKGCSNCIEAIFLLYTDMDGFKLVTKALYPQIAKKFKTTDSRVERNIRHAIGSAFKKDSTVFSKYFGEDLKRPPTKSEFLFTLATYLRAEDEIS